MSTILAHRSSWQAPAGSRSLNAKSENQGVGLQIQGGVAGGSWEGLSSPFAAADISSLPSRGDVAAGPFFSQEEPGMTRGSSSFTRSKGASIG